MSHATATPITLILSSTLLAITTPAQAQLIWYVDDTSTNGMNDGSDWANAFLELQTALAASQVGDEIRVAQGLYLPDYDLNSNGHTGDRALTFALPGGVSLYGGYAGLGAPDPDLRDAEGHPVILSGDLAGNDVTTDGPVPGNRAENSYHVVTALGTNGVTRLDGFVITRGLANGGGADHSGAGVLITGDQVTLANCIVQSNSAYDAGAGVYVDGSDATLVACTLRDNVAFDYGGGVYSNGGNPQIVDCTFDANQANGGAGMFNDEGSPTLTRCRFTRNAITQSGFVNSGGGLLNDSGAAILTACQFLGNSAWQSGGAIFNDDGAQPVMVNCLFVGNTADYGGGIANLASGPTIINCTMVGNTADDSGGALDNYESGSILANCVLWGNTAPAGPQIHNAVSSWADVTYSCVEGGYVGGNIDEYPEFERDPDAGTNGWGDDLSTPDADEGADDDFGDLHLTADSPCIDVGNNAAVPGGVTTDIAGVARFLDDPGTPDGGSGTPPIVDMGAYEYVAIDCNNNGILDVEDIAEGTSHDCNDNGVPDECEIGGVADCNLNGASDLCDLHAATSVDCNDNAVPDECEISSGTSADCNANDVIDECDLSGGTSADCNATGTPDECETIPTGTLYVDDSAAAGGNLGSSWADAFTELGRALALARCTGTIDEIRVAAGVYTPESAGLSIPRQATYALVSGVTIAGGYAGYGAAAPNARDINAYPTVLSGDIGALGSAADNCYHVVTGSGADASAVLDGVTITAGNANGGGEDNNGGGVFNDGGHPTLTNCMITANAAAGVGGGMANVSGASPTLIDCIFQANAAMSGGALTNDDSSAVLVNCIFVDNLASGLFSVGGGIYNYAGATTLTNCTLSGNSASGMFSTGGGIYNDSSDPTLANCVLWGNSAPAAPEMANAGTSSPVVIYSCIQGGYGGAGNIGGLPAHDPLFADADLRLGAGSACINAGTNTAPELPASDLDGHARILCSQVDMGAYEFGIGDHDCDQDVDLDDFADWGACITGPGNGPYLTGCEAFDFEYDLDVDLADFAGFQDAFTGAGASLNLGPDSGTRWRLTKAH